MHTKPNYKELSNFYNENYYSAYNVVDKISVANDSNFIVFPFHKIVTTYYSTAVCADLPNFEIDDETKEHVQNWIKKNKIYTKITMIAEELSIFGNCYFELITNTFEEKKEAILISHSVDTVTVIKDSFYYEDDKIQYLVKKLLKIGNTEYIVNSLHSKTQKEIFLTKIDDEKNKKVFLDDEIKTALSKYYVWSEEESSNTSLIQLLNAQSFFHFKNTATMCIYGESDYTTQFNNFVYKYAKRLMQIDSILDRHADPRLKIGKQTLAVITAEFGKELQRRGITSPKTADLDSILNSNDSIRQIARENDLDIAQIDYILKKTKIYPTSPFDGGLEYVTWNAELTSSFTFLDIVFNAILMIIGMNKQMVSNDIALANLSGVAFDKMIRVFKAKVKRKRDSIADTLTDIIETAYYLEKGEATIIESRWHDNIDDQELIKNMYIELYNNHLATRKMAIEKIYDVDEKMAIQIEKNIENENNTELLTINE